MSDQLDYVAPLTCDKCPRLFQFINQHKPAHPDWHNGPVPSFGPIEAPILILGLAPGLKGANATGQPFTGDFAGDVLYETLLTLGMAKGVYSRKKDAGLILTTVRIANAVRCVPPQNKPNALEIATCRPYLTSELARMTNLKAIFVLGRIAHKTVLRHYNLRISSYPFKHDDEQNLPNGLTLVSSYHCSRYNINTKRLTQEMFQSASSRLKKFI